MTEATQGAPAPAITLTPCNSSQVESHGYDAATQTLAVKFRRGGLYHYTGVPQSVADGLAKAESAGKFVGSQLVNKFPYARQPDRPAAVAPSLWAVHVEGPDDLQAAPSKEAADKAVAMLNAHFTTRGPQDVLCKARAITWPHDAEAHVEDLASWPEFAGDELAKQPA